jgi:hypothetical protein
MKLQDKVPFEFLGEDHTGVVVELYTCTGRSMALIQSDKDGKRYPIDISNRVKKKPKKAKKVTKKEKVLSLLKIIDPKPSGEIRIDRCHIVEVGLDPTPLVSGKFTDTFYIKKVFREMGYVIKGDGTYFVMHLQKE